MNLEVAVNKHVDWKAKLRLAISKKETLDATTIAKDDCCDLGKWLYGEGKLKFGQLTSYSDCVAKHKAFHSNAGRVATAINAKKYEEAMAMIGMNIPYADASTVAIGAILKLKKEASL